LLRVVVGKSDASFGNAVDIRWLVTHHATISVVDVPGANIVTPNNEDIGFLLLRKSAGRDTY
jgi:hypothetical protein